MSLRLKTMLSFLRFAVLILVFSASCGLLPRRVLGAQNASQQADGQNPQVAAVTSYVDEPIEQLLRTVPETGTLQPSKDQTPLGLILNRCGKNVDAEFKDFGDLVAKETVLETLYNPTTDMDGQPITRPHGRLLQENEYEYYIVREGTLVETRIREFRQDKYGSDGRKPPTSPGLETTPAMTFLSANFASSLLYFSSAYTVHDQEKFRYLGEQRLETHDTYVVAFAQVPGASTTGVSMTMANDEPSTWLVQGIAWIDKSTFDILQMRTDLFEPLHSSSLPQQSSSQFQTQIQFAPVQPTGIAHVMWLPTKADVHLLMADTSREVATNAGYKNPVQIALNVHQFSKYRKYDHIAANVAVSEEIGANGVGSAGQVVDHPYLEQPLRQLTKRIPELKGISPAPDQKSLAMILQQTGKQVDDFFANLVDLIAREDITQRELNTCREFLRRTTDGPTRIEEFRMDTKGNRIDETGTEKGFFVTSGFALSSIYFATRFQWDSRFLVLGEQKIDGHDTYVVAFAQSPSDAKVAVTMRGKDGASLHLFSQGVAWIDTTSFRIRRLRTDLLAPLPEIGLSDQTTTIAYSEVQFPDRPPLWLPHDVNMDIQFKEHTAAGVLDFGSRVTDQEFSNSHHYSDYKLYRVSAKIGASH